MHIVGIKTSMAILGPRAAVPGRTRTRALQAGRVDRPRGAGGKASDYDHAYTGHSLLRSAVSALAFWTTPLAYCKKCAQRSYCLLACALSHRKFISTPWRPTPLAQHPLRALQAELAEY